jgi:hypothetical protein
MTTFALPGIWEAPQEVVCPETEHALTKTAKYFCFNAAVYI